MKTRRLIILVLSIITVQYASAQTAIFKEPVSFKLKNGMNIIVAENLGTSKVYSSFTIDGDAVSEGNKPGIENLLNAMLNEDVAQSGTGISFNEKGGNLASNTVNFDLALSTLSRSVRQPALTDPAFAKLKSDLIASFNAHDRYYPESVTLAALEDLTLEDVKSFCSKHITPSRASLTIAGNISTAQAKILVKKAFGDWEEVASIAKHEITE
ncbi:insulinase family protein [Pedobacter metabolipauper]|uniref:Peptidase M16-like protein n=1 Tax=Pedobacter metabolipauper TaxID=425513 RepID=A0A4R6SYD7_9SPHI|nr:insulinase family protein [Pedobacter metabolipauper]TDQ09694.1 peptidase M16-like protein [Pedobacter metabolipauper]